MIEAFHSYGLKTVFTAQLGYFICNWGGGSRSEHHDPELGSLHDSFCPSVSVEFFENRGDVKFDGVEGNPQPARDCFVGGTICHRREHLKFAGRQLRIPVIACVELLTQK